MRMMGLAFMAALLLPGLLVVWIERRPGRRR